MKVRGKQISACIREKLDEIEPKSNRPYSAVLTDIVISIAIDPKSNTKDKLNAIEFLVNRVEGTPVNTNLNAEIVSSPLEGISTSKIEALIAKLQEIPVKP